ncbi:hypothetical protein SAMN04489860_0223 [Paraoerskovia marina]|uniref:Uncharacterized protein n=1 Tax=Paraoerskovia marina TaxID=545619 RepID=A0A1H1MFR0_9CELL|nr:hypothetical protein [Paraoerskovia marina]SDR85442.1 hypothetical protein SAMN04489860_0223 [Paraoerskovia marina]
MNSPAARRSADQAVRVARAVVVASTTFAFAAAAHTAAGGTLPSGLGTATLASIALMVAAAVGRRPLAPVTLVPVLVTLQAVLHLGFMTLAGHGASTGGTPESGGHAAHDPALAVELVSGLASAAEAGAHGGAHTHPAMLGAHLLAVVVTTVLAVGSDRALLRIAARLSGLVQILAGTTVVDGRRRARRPRDVDGPGRPFDLTVLLVRRPRRGPPVVARTA